MIHALTDIPLQRLSGARGVIVHPPPRENISQVRLLKQTYETQKFAMHVEALLPIRSRDVGDSWVADHEESREDQRRPDDGPIQVLKVEIVNTGLSKIC